MLPSSDFPRWFRKTEKSSYGGHLYVKPAANANLFHVTKFPLYLSFTHLFIFTPKLAVSHAILYR